MKDLKEKTTEELRALLAEAKNESHSLRYSFSATQKNNVNKARELKKTIAHIETILSNSKK